MNKDRAEEDCILGDVVIGDAELNGNAGIQPRIVMLLSGFYLERSTAAVCTG